MRTPGKAGSGAVPGGCISTTSPCRRLPLNSAAPGMPPGALIVRARAALRRVHEGKIGCDDLRQGVAAMTDPLEVLRRPLVPLAPDPAFAARLRERIKRAVTTEGEA